MGMIRLSTHTTPDPPVDVCMKTLFGSAETLEWIRQNRTRINDSQPAYISCMRPHDMRQRTPADAGISTNTPGIPAPSCRTYYYSARLGTTTSSTAHSPTLQHPTLAWQPGHKFTHEHQPRESFCLYTRDAEAEASRPWDPATGPLPAPRNSPSSTRNRKIASGNRLPHEFIYSLHSPFTSVQAAPQP